MPRRRVDVFFYGLFMDADLLRSKGLDPQGAELAYLPGYELRLGDRAALAPREGGCVHGVVMSMTSAQVDELYSESSVSEYRPQPVVVYLTGGGDVCAVCYNLDDPPASDARNPEYAEKLRAVGTKVGLPTSYLEALPV